MIKVSYKGDGEAVIIIGGNSGIGLALSEILNRSGVEIISIDIQKESSSPISKLKYFSANPTVKQELQEVKKEMLKTSVKTIGLVNLSGTIAYFGTIENAENEDWNTTYDISFKSCLNSCQVFSSLLRKTSGSAIVNMSSGLAFIGQKNYGPYSAAKAAIVSLTRTLAVELAPNIRVNSLAPGAVDTPFIYKKDGGTRFDFDGYRARIPLGTIATPLEIASVILYLLSNGSSHITGECIHVNGGVG